MIIYHSVLRMGNVSNKAVGKIKTYLMFNNFFSENRAVYELMRKSMVKLYRPQMEM